MPVDQAYELVQQFTQMLRTRTGEQLDAWLEKVRASQIGEGPRFVAGVERDKKAVKARLTLPQSNGMGDRKSEHTELGEEDGLWQSRFTCYSEYTYLVPNDKNDQMEREGVL